MKFVFNKINLILFIIATVVTIVGYIVMKAGDNTVSPIILTIAYVILFPLAIMFGIKKSS